VREQDVEDGHGEEEQYHPPTPARDEPAVGKNEEKREQGRQPQLGQELGQITPQGVVRGGVESLGPGQPEDHEREGDEKGTRLPRPPPEDDYPYHGEAERDDQVEREHVGCIGVDRHAESFQGARFRRHELPGDTRPRGADSVEVREMGRNARGKDDRRQRDDTHPQSARDEKPATAQLPGQ
jgi:hypothetical protein